MSRLELNGVSAVVTGGASGIGEACVRALAAAGAKAVVADLQDERGAAIADEVGGRFVHCDVTSSEDGEAAVAAAGVLGPLRVLVNSAGLGPAARTINRDNVPMPLEKFERIIGVNLIGSFNMLRLAAAAMAATDPVNEDGDRGAIVNMASVAAFDGQIGQAAYSASKGGIVGMTLPIARDLSAVGVRVNTVAPGLIDTPIYGQGSEAEEFKARLGASVLYPKRLGSGEELASMVMELVTNPYMNGETVRVDAGIRLPPR